MNEDLKSYKFTTQKKGMASKYRTLLRNIKVLSGMCGFSFPEILRTEKEQFVCRQYDRLNVELTDLVNLVSKN